MTRANEVNAGRNEVERPLMADSIVSQEPLVIVAMVLMNPFNINTVYSATTVKKRDFERSATEIWIPRNNETVTEMTETTLQKAVALLPGRGTVYWTGPGLDDVNLLARGQINFVQLDKKDNPNYKIAEELATKDWLAKYQ